MKDFTPVGPEPFSLYGVTYNSNPDIPIKAQMIFSDLNDNLSLDEQYDVMVKLLRTVLDKPSSDAFQQLVDNNKIGLTTTVEIVRYVMTGYGVLFPIEPSKNSVELSEVSDSGQRLTDGAQEGELIRPSWSTHAAFI